MILKRVLVHLLSHFINFDSIYFQFADIINTNSTLIFKENLGDETDFRAEPIYQKPILTKEKSTNYTKVDYFRSPDEPYLIFEYKCNFILHIFPS